MHPRHGEERRADPGRIRLDDRRGRRGDARLPRPRSARRLGGQVVVRERSASRGGSRTTMPAWPGPKSTSTVSFAMPPSAWTTPAIVAAGPGAEEPPGAPSRTRRPPSVRARPRAPRRRAAAPVAMNRPGPTAGTRRPATGPSCRRGTGRCRPVHTRRRCPRGRRPVPCAARAPAVRWSWRTTQPSGTATSASARRATDLPPVGCIRPTDIPSASRCPCAPASPSPSSPAVGGCRRRQRALRAG